MAFYNFEPKRASKSPEKSSCSIGQVLGRFTFETNTATGSRLSGVVFTVAIPINYACAVKILRFSIDEMVFSLPLLL